MKHRPIEVAVQPAQLRERGAEKGTRRIAADHGHPGRLRDRRRDLPVAGPKHRADHVRRLTPNQGATQPAAHPTGKETHPHARHRGRVRTGKPTGAPSGVREHQVGVRSPRDEPEQRHQLIDPDPPVGSRRRTEPFDLGRDRATQTESLGGKVPVKLVQAVRVWRIEDADGFEQREGQRRVGREDG